MPWSVMLQKFRFMPSPDKHFFIFIIIALLITKFDDTTEREKGMWVRGRTITGEKDKQIRFLIHNDKNLIEFHN